MTAADRSIWLRSHAVCQGRCIRCGMTAAEILRWHLQPPALCSVPRGDAVRTERAALASDGRGETTIWPRGEA